MIKKQQKTILIANKNPQKIKNTLLMLNHTPYKKLFTYSENTFIKIIKKTPSIDLILLDINLILNSSKNVFIQSLKINPNLKIIVTAQQKIKLLFQKQILFNAYEVILKPFDIDEVLTTITKIIDKKN